MKKLSLILLGALAAIQAAQAAPASFNGYYLGGQLGWTQRNDKTSIPGVDTTDSGVRFQQGASNKTKKANGLTYGLYTGYGHNNNGFYFGGEFSIEGDSASKNVSNGLAPTATALGVVTTGTGKIDTKYERGVVFGITPRLGAVIANENLIYAKLGLEFSRDKVKASYDASGRAAGTNYSRSGKVTASKNQFVFVPGIGYERAFGNLLARVEYGYNLGGKITTGNLINGVNSATTVKYTAHVVKFGLAHKF
ncbi:outer membrane protein [Candidatus Finniella inopinata]|uniref:Outer membrane protein beta-barrel domain-containing protein n=1 Tax=Candidatus Finniella inopinata TaxID=1696036 RepID=A0A4Q7DHN9_9PROT|nr:outer membrane beta-barrel protein [Candidatus Finniella inopinata]RZI45808.1 hypothetical protein EQU50_05070 [Candidatus Finniella inopinata]